MKKHVVAAVGAIPEGGRIATTVSGRPIVIFNVEGEFYGLHNRCPHEGGPLSAGKITGLVQSSGPGEVSLNRQGQILRCPWHGWEFDIKTGKSYCDPTKVAARCYNVAVQPGSQVVEGPFVAETVKVSVEDDYVVVEL
jgi:3-phenylpropionate/trans-cinnamate dioxygenase ferredoxin subunit